MGAGSSAAFYGLRLFEPKSLEKSLKTVNTVPVVPRRPPLAVHCERMAFSLSRAGQDIPMIISFKVFKKSISTWTPSSLYSANFSPLPTTQTVTLAAVSS